MPLPFSIDFFTLEITNDVFVVDRAMNFRALAILNTSAVSGTVSGSYTIPGQESGDLTLSQGQSMTFGSGENAAVLDGITITAPAGCTIQITAEI